MYIKFGGICERFYWCLIVTDEIKESRVLAHFPQVVVAPLTKSELQRLPHSLRLPAERAQRETDGVSVGL